MNKKIFTILIITLVLYGCQTAPQEREPVLVVTDVLGREAAFTDYPTRIVIAGRQTPMLANFAYLFDSAVEKIAAIENRSQSADRFLTLIDSAYDSKLILERGAGAEQISPVEADVVILKTAMKDQVGDQLEEIGATPVYVSFESIDEIYFDMMVLGEIFQEETKAEAVITFFKDKKSTIDGLVAEAVVSPRILVVQIEETEGEFSFSVPSPNWLQTVMVDELNALAVWKEDVESGGWIEVNFEQIIAWDPEILTVVNYQGDAVSIISQLEADPVWESFIENSGISVRPFPYDFQSWDQPDPRWLLGYASLAHFLYPDLVDSMFVFDLVRDFYQDLYGLDGEYIETDIFSLIQSQLE